jgi:PKD repeat protein
MMKNPISQLARRAAWCLPVLLVTLAPPAQAAEEYLADWIRLYPNSLTDDNSGAGDQQCMICHGTGTSNLNAYGAAFCSQGGNTDERIQAAENVDSDMDPTGSNNITEINASTQPGWTAGPNNMIFSRRDCSPNGTVVSAPGFITGNLDPGAANMPPVADANGPYDGTVGVPVSFDGTGSTDPEGAILTNDWDFGDGNTGTGPSAGTTATIGVGNQPPVADAGGPYMGTIGQPVIFDATGSMDPDGTITAYMWDFGDGKTGTGPTPSHSYAADGVYNVTLTVTDDAGATDSAGTRVTIEPVADVFLSKLQAPKSVKTATGNTVSKSVTATGDGNTTQDASVTLAAVASAGVTVSVPGPVSDAVSAGNGSTRFKFGVQITCDAPGPATIDWAATIGASGNEDPGNDTITGTTSVNCR